MYLLFQDVVGDEPAHRVNTYDNNRIKISQQTGTLTIVNTKLDDSAKYICSATNGYGPTITASAFVSVRKRSIVKKEPEHVLLQVIIEFLIPRTVSALSRSKFTFFI